MRSTEYEEQCAVVEWFDLQYPKFRGRLFAVPNGAHLAGTGRQRSAKVARMKAEGMRNGIPDLWLPVARHGFHGLVIELKNGRGKPTAEQEDWLNFLAAQDYCATACWGATAAIETIRSYLNV